jgi:prepilin signal peptidase PulO-like enzyme (type II secretory pathway)
MGKCRKCDNIISPHYPIIEIVVGLIFVFVANFYSYGSASPVLSAELFRDLVILIFLTFIFLYDYKYREILNFTTILPGIVLFFLALFFGWRSWDSMLLGAAFGAGFFLFLYFISKGGWIGGGDVRLGFFMGIILGWPCVLVAFFIAYVLGAIFSLLLIGLKKKTMKSETAFGTYLVFGTFVAMFWCSHILEWYFGLII